MNKALPTPRAADEGAFEAGIEWIVARQLAPLQDEILRLRAYLEALVEVREPW